MPGGGLPMGWHLSVSSGGNRMGRSVLAGLVRERLNGAVENTWTPARQAVESEDAETLARLPAAGVTRCDA